MCVSDAEVTLVSVAVVSLVCCVAAEFECAGPGLLGFSEDVGFGVGVDVSAVGWGDEYGDGVVVGMDL